MNPFNRKEHVFVLIKRSRPLGLIPTAPNFKCKGKGGLINSSPEQEENEMRIENDWRKLSSFCFRGNNRRKGIMLKISSSYYIAG